ncbi:flagellar basal body rod protein FlgC [Bradyrhizobium sp. GCM10027634]|uniref:flagellar basal body rod protein FlgC n=1 Tax=unclassified Bradyrhizobium TaxID=2631580 RepID=UPI00188BB816|nr:MULTISPECIES: flagellar basal body rod C-terminal domain-containing protein [unclassified Bradyrhizobium]MDN5001082.1 flagellar basal body rod C-terminal domain-containing protein [Bradyrhizobium sp. WYCCWR 12677]QOZ46463.1 flagellar biosynthesis protein FlgC [Bradyrhizobium sp. CCBAU 53340]
MSIYSIATSGLSAASLRVNVAASNVANTRTTGPLPASGGSSAGTGSSSASSSYPAAYVPLRVDQVAQSSGSTPAGTSAIVSTVSPSYVAQSDPSAPFANQDGLVAAPNVDLADQFVQLAAAKYSFIANAKVIQAYSETEKSLLDIKT